MEFSWFKFHWKEGTYHVDSVLFQVSTIGNVWKHFLFDYMPTPLVILLLLILQITEFRFMEAMSKMKRVCLILGLLLLLLYKLNNDDDQVTGSGGGWPADGTKWKHMCWFHWSSQIVDYLQICVLKWLKAFYLTTSLCLILFLSLLQNVQDPTLLTKGKRSWFHHHQQQSQWIRS